ncbi:SPASM domain-containing protein [Candidatus Gracilibacteria bacterium]|nr:SPASM domain-containing protein [Candidatus Gracilibacteria bacterium]
MNKINYLSIIDINSNYFVVDYYNLNIFYHGKKYPNNLFKYLNKSENNCKFAHNSTLDYQFSLKKIESVAISISNKCNFKCVHCYNNSLSKKNYITGNNALSQIEAYKKLKNLISKIISIKNVKIIKFFGGEPLLYKNALKKIITEPAFKKLKWSIITNFSLLTKKDIIFFTKNNVNIKFNFDINNETYNKITGATTNKYYNNILKLLPIIKSFKTKFRIGIVLTHLNNNLFKFYLLLKKYNLQDRFIYNYVSTSNKKYMLSEEDINKFKQDFIKLINEDIKSSRDKKLKIFNTPRLPINSCGAFYNYIAFDLLGNIYPCHRFIGLKKYVFENIFEYTNSNNKKIDKFIKKNNEILKIKCSNCYLNNFCKGNCHYDRLISKHYNCEIIKFTFDALLKKFLKLKLQNLPTTR